MRKIHIAIVLLTALAAPAIGRADRIKDLTTIAGVRDNHLTGFGLVVGLDGTGDDAQSPTIKGALTKMLKRLGLTIDPTQLKGKNVAAVMITAELPAFAKPGMSFDVTISSMGNAKSLAGGTLLAAPLRGPDDRTWAIAQGALSVGGFIAEGGSGSSSKKNHPTVGRLPGGATVEAAAPTVMPDREIALVLKQPDFTTATRMRDAIVAVRGENSARMVDAATIVVGIPAAERSHVRAARQGRDHPGRAAQQGQGQRGRSDDARDEEGCHGRRCRCRARRTRRQAARPGVDPARAQGRRRAAR
jgi:flagellar P-ring protein precursor FlgI